MSKPVKFKNDEMYIEHHRRPSDGPPYFVVYCCGSSRMCATEESVIELIQDFKLKTIEEFRSFLRSQSSSRQGEQSHQEAAE